MTALAPSRRHAWLAERRGGIGASEVAAILGVDAHGRSAYQVWAEKVSDITLEDSIDMARGRRFERVIGEEYSIQTGRPIFPKADPYEITWHPDLPWLFATLDMTTDRGEILGMDDGGRTMGYPDRGPLQIKMAIGSARDWKDEPPLGYLVQVQMEIACSRSAWGALAALVGPGPLRVTDLERDDAFLRRAIPVLEEFHDRVKTRRPPEADGLPGTTEALRRLYADEDGETVTLDQAALELVEAIEGHRLLRDTEDEEITSAENQLRALMGSASFGLLGDGTILTLRKVQRREYSVQAASYRALRRIRPRLRLR